MDTIVHSAIGKPTDAPKANLPQSGDIILGIRTDVCHTIGYQLIQKCLQRVDIHLHSVAPWDNDGRIVSELIHCPTISYATVLSALWESGKITSMANIDDTGFHGGMVKLATPTLCGIINNYNMMNNIMPKMLKWVQYVGQFTDNEMYKSFNMGIGMLIVVSQNHCTDVINIVESYGLSIAQVGILLPKL